MSSLTGSATRRLSSARLELSDPQRHRTGVQVIALVALIALAATLAPRFHTDGLTTAASPQDLESRNAALTAELARVRTELAMERATRTSLDRQVAELNERIAELRNQIDFFNAQRGHPRAAK